MTILQANKFYFLKGGAERYALELSAWLSAQGNEVVPFAMRHPGNLETPYAEFFPSFVETERVRFGVAGVRTIGRMLYSFEARRKMGRLVDATHPDVAHIHNVYTQLSPSILDALRARDVPTVMTVHDHHLVSPQYNVWAEGCGVDVSRMGVFRAASTRFHKDSYAASLAQAAVQSFHYHRGSYRNRVDLFLTPSEYMRRRLLAAGFPGEKVRTVPYGIDAGAVVPRYDHDGYMVYVGRLSEEKGVETAIEIARRLPELSLKIVGTGPAEESLHALAHGAGNVEFVGFRSGESLRELVRGAMCSLIPSRVHENFPLVALESMAVGTPVVASNVGGIPEVVEDRVTGLLAAPTDLHGFVEAVMRLAYDDDYRLSLARAARLSVETTFHVAAHHAAVMRAYADVIALHGKGG